ncbi:ScbA/BarX family gamma-butyrolactone biosynthesis protein [Streptomyces sp. NPDC047917]|uniref:ScbA/BarX family gamma-butyrolactone biosynthesis protein n=1 Tax=Streptomyces sp. NPDC047917 TaxID=3365491 RepID=UPI003710A1D6
MSRTLVHKAAPSEVFLTDMVRASADRYRVAAKWPERHTLFGTGPRRTLDPLLLVETVRQAGLCLTQRYYDVPQDHQFVLSSLEYELDTSPRSIDAGRAVDTAVIEVRCQVEVSRADYLSMSLDAVILTEDGIRLGQVGFCWRSLSPQRYEQLRFSGEGPRAPAPDGTLADPVATPAAVGRSHGKDVMLAPGNSVRNWRFRLDRQHPVYFDHACDHIPGMALLESFQQAAWLMSAHAEGVDAENWLWSPTAGALTFQSFGELDAPTTIDAEVAQEPSAYGQHAVRVSATQGGTVLATAALLGSGFSVAGGGML